MEGRGPDSRRTPKTGSSKLETGNPYNLSRWLRPGDLTPPAADDVVLPLPRHLSPADWGRRLLIWLVLLAGLLILLRFDVVLMRWRFLVIPDEPSGGLRQILFGLRDFGQIVPMVVVGVIVFLTDRRRLFFIGTLLLAQLLVALFCQPMKWCLPRYRPHAAIAEVAEPRVQALPPVERMAGAEASAETPKDYAGLLAHVKPGETWIFGDGQERPRKSIYEAFPSGHSGAAFAFATILAWFYPHLRGVCWALALGCAGSRYLDAAHWPGDCMAGAMLGYVAGWVALRPYVWVLPVILLRRRTKRRHARARSRSRNRVMIQS